MGETVSDLLYICERHQVGSEHLVRLAGERRERNGLLLRQCSAQYFQLCAETNTCDVRHTHILRACTQNCVMSAWHINVDVTITQCFICTCIVTRLFEMNWRQIKNTNTNLYCLALSMYSCCSMPWESTADTSMMFLSRETRSSFNVMTANRLCKH